MDGQNLYTNEQKFINTKNATINVKNSLSWILRSMETKIKFINEALENAQINYRIRDNLTSILFEEIEDLCNDMEKIQEGTHRYDIDYTQNTVSFSEKLGNVSNIDAKTGMTSLGVIGNSVSNVVNSISASFVSAATLTGGYMTAVSLMGKDNNLTNNNSSKTVKSTKTVSSDTTATTNFAPQARKTNANQTSAINNNDVIKKTEDKAENNNLTDNSKNNESNNNSNNAIKQPNQVKIVTPPSNPSPQEILDIKEEQGPPSNNDYTPNNYTPNNYAHLDGGRVVYTPNKPIETLPQANDTVTNEGMIDEIIKGKTIKMPTSSAPLPSANSSGSGSTVIPIVAGLGAAAAAGLGAKAYMDHKNNNDTEEEYNLEESEWNGTDIADTTVNKNIEELDVEDEYNTYQEEPEKYGARNNEELADLQ